ncbi:ring-cleaving dioxygenase [Alkalibacterium sp. 20]|uniref:ring-cleaving dioxygenase n=1 Tax=Alkalibacterium sp. 20 TaxID=1798803 RepID=UPI00090025E8|nr:ring-cleaving dioxygenase [Alkalibacterium sp. 20]OJF92557.1 glyoxalase [Alkalibacterium sp. 20]
MKQLKGIHHVTAITSSAEKIYDFFTHVLGLRLVKKTVNQDDIQTYHLFFADDKGSAGTDMTFFDFPGISKGVHGNDEIARTSFRVPTNNALEYWLKRFDRLKVKHEGIQEQFGKKVIPFVDFDEQAYQLISDENNSGVASGTPWQNGPIPLGFAITGLGRVFLRYQDLNYIKEVLEQVYEMKHIDTEDNLYLFEMGEGGNGAEVVVEHNTELQSHQQGYGTVHHVAFRVDDKEDLDNWKKIYQSVQLPNSGYVNRFYFGSLYARVTAGILVELATEGPGFMEDEPYETLGEKLSLPPFLENQRAIIENEVRYIDTVRSTKTFEKEYE